MELRLCEVDKGGAARVTNMREAGPSTGSADEDEEINVLTKMAKWEYDLAA